MNRQHSRGFRYRRNSTGWQGSRLRWIAVVAIGVAAGAWSAQADDQIQKGEMAGYLLVPNEKVPESYNAGFSMYVAAWPLLDQYWYRFADQPAILNADLTDTEREALQERVVKIHRSWKNDRDYLAPPAFGKLAELDPALIVTPPPGLEAGYVPIVTRQALAE